MQDSVCAGQQMIAGETAIAQFADQVPCQKAINLKSGLKILFDAQLHPFLDRLLNPLGRWLVTFGVVANHVTIIGAFFGLDCRCMCGLSAI